jgi:hypothetical protein
VNVPLVVAGSMALFGAAVHGAGGEMLVVRRLAPGMLPSSPFGGPLMTKAMIRATWHITTIAFLTVGSALLLAGSVLHGDAARGIALVAAGAASGFAGVMLVVGGSIARAPRALFRHPGPAVFTTVAVLAWWGAAIFTV